MEFVKNNIEMRKTLKGLFLIDKNGKIPKIWAYFDYTNFLPRTKRFIKMYCRGRSNLTLGEIIYYNFFQIVDVVMMFGSLFDISYQVKIFMSYHEHKFFLFPNKLSPTRKRCFRSSALQQYPGATQLAT